MHRLIAALPLFVCVALGSDPKALTPGQVLEFEFPQLPASLDAVSKGIARFPQMTARLPDNYTRDREFPVFVYLIGGAGTNGDDRALGDYVIGRNDYVCVSLPLFKRALDTSESNRGLMVSMDDFAVISSSYRTMLTTLFEAVPNLTARGSVFGGHSNGAHTTGVLLAGQDDFLFRHFEGFFLHEGGIGPLFANVLHKGPMKRSRFLVMMGGGSPGADAARTSAFQRLPSVLREMTERMRLNFTFVTMEGYGHEQPPEYLSVIGQWSRGEPLADIPALRRQWIAALALPLRHHPDSRDWPDFLNADLSTHRVPPGRTWSFRDGVLTATGDGTLWTRLPLGSLVLDFEYRLAPGADSGVLLYAADPETWRTDAIEIQLCDDAHPRWQEQPAQRKTGAWFGHQAPRRSVTKPAGEWNRMTILTQGPAITVVLNGEVVNEIQLTRWTDAAVNPDGSAIPPDRQGRPKAELPTTGRTGFQGSVAEGTVEFRHVKVLRLDL